MREAEREARRLGKELREGGGVAGYTDEDNPFGDANLSQRFVWGKKVARDGAAGGAGGRAAHEQRLREIEKVKQRRREREEERIQKEEELSQLAKDRAAAEALEYEAREEAFLRAQVQVRSNLRAEDGRANPVDLLAQNLRLDPSVPFGTEDPAQVFDGLTRGEAAGLLEEVRAHAGLDAEDPEAARFWRALRAVGEESLERAAWAEGLAEARAAGRPVTAELRRRDPGLHAALDEDVEALLEGRSQGDLDALHAEVSARVARGEGDVEYWESILRRVAFSRERAALRAIYGRRREAHAEAVALVARQEEADGGAGGAGGAGADGAGGAGAGAEGGAGRACSPELEDVAPLDGEEVVDEESDLRALEEARARAARTSPAEARPLLPGGDSDEARLAAFSGRLMGAAGEGDAAFSHEVPLETREVWWHDKYRPRKPKFFNRVHTGYEWTKYNKTHYDSDNPPPKVVQGYKFNVFYPDLIDVTKAPRYNITHDPECPDGSTCLIRFSAGPPYEDIAFRIVNKEWNYTAKRGFRCVFERGILHLYFNFKRSRYRR